MGDLIQFPVGGRSSRPEGPVKPSEPAPGVSVMFCASCEEKRSCGVVCGTCGGRVFTNHRARTVGIGAQVTQK